MLTNIAQQLADSISHAIGYDITIMNTDSVIIGSSDRSRLGLVHEGSFEVFRLKRPVEYDDVERKRFKNTKPGYQFPLFLNNKIIGVIGIVGTKKEVKKYAELIRIHAEIMLREFVHQKSLIYTEQAVSSFMQELLAFNPKVMDESLILSRGYELGYDLSPPHMAIAIKMTNLDELSKNYYTSDTDDSSSEVSFQSLKADILNIVKLCFSRNDLSTFSGNDSIIILHSLPLTFNESDVLSKIRVRCNSLIDRLSKKDIHLNIGIGSIAQNIEQLSRACKDAWMTLKITSSYNELNKIYHIEDFCIEALLASSAKDFSDWYIERMASSLLSNKDGEDFFETIKCWCLSGFNQKKASEMLYIHRNTLNHRISRISELSKMDLRNPKQAISLYLAVLLLESM